MGMVSGVAPAAVTLPEDAVTDVTDHRLRGTLSRWWQIVEIRTKLGSGGRLVIPSGYRRALGVSPGDEVILVLEDGAVRVLTPREAVRRAQSLVRRYVAPSARLADELIQDRRKEARRESRRP
jgi:AbrB family looped-hinge helix DNA binding protein